MTSSPSPQNRSLFSRLWRGGAWLAGANASEQALRFIRNMVLTRLLLPEAFGTMAIVLSVSGLFQVLTTVGVREAIVQNPHGTERTYLNGAWWLSAVRSLILYAAAFLSAPAIASFYGKPELVDLIRVAFLNVVFQGWLSAGAYVAMKQMRYGAWVAVQQGGGFIGVAAALGLALWLKSVWALVIGYVIEGAARCLISHIVTPFRPGLQFHREHLKALFAYSRGIFGLPALMMIYTEGATMVVGKVCPADQLGLYAMALSLARMPSLFGSIMVDLLMPAFSEIQNQPARMNQGIVKVMSALALLAVPALTFACLFGGQLLRVIYGPFYAAAAIPFALLFANELLITFNMPLVSVYMACGKPSLLRSFSFARALLLMALIYPATKMFGLTGAAATALLAMATSAGLQLAGVRRLTGLDLGRLAVLMSHGLPLALPVIAASILSQMWPHQLSPVASVFTALALTAGGFLCLAVWVLRSQRMRAYFWPFARDRRTV